MNEELKITITAETDTDGFNDAEKAIKEVGEATKEASAKLKSITDVWDEQAEELDKLKKSYIDIVAEQGESSMAAIHLADDIQSLTNEMRDNEKAIEEANKAFLKRTGIMDKANSAAKIQEAELKKLKNEYIDVVAAEGKNSKSAKELAEKIKKLSGELKENKDAIDDAEKEYRKLDATMDTVSDNTEKIDGAFASAGESIKNGLVAGVKAGATAVAAMGASMVALVEGTEEYRKNQALLTSAFETAGSSATMAKETYNDLYRVLGDNGQATEAAQHLAKLTNEEKDLSEWTTICQGVYATFGDSLPIESLTEAANETAKTGQLTGALADALNWAGINEENFQAQLDACNTEAEREQLIRETLNGTYAESAAAYEENAKSILAANEAQAKLDEALASTGAALEPVMTVLKELGAEVLTAIAPHIAEFAENHLPGIKDALTQVGTTLSETITWIKEHQTLLGVMAGIIGGIVVAIGLYNAVAAVRKAMEVAEVASLGALVAAQTATAASALLMIAPYVAIVAAIAAVIAIIVLCIKNWDDIWATIKEVWENIKQATIEAVENVKQSFENFKQGVIEKVSATLTAISEKFESIKTNMREKIDSAKTTVLGIFDNIRDGIKSRLDGAREFVKGAIEKIKGFFNFKWELPKIKLPHFSISGKFSLNPPSIPKFSVSWYEKGGVFDNPTLFGYGNGQLGGLGENGAEAVVPLEKNTEWLDKIAEKLAMKQGATGPIVLQVDGKTFAQISVDSINQLTRQRGNIPLHMY